jgi:hypothetical protein
MLRLTREAIDRINADTVIKAKLAAALGKSQGSVQRYVNSNDPLLTTASALEVIKKETGLKTSEILTRGVITSDPGDEVEHITEA